MENMQRQDVYEKQSVSKISALTYQDWQPLLALIPIIENTTCFGQWKGGSGEEETGDIFPYCESAPVVKEFLKLAYETPIIVIFDWGAWDQGQQIANDNEFDFDTIDVLTKCKLITAILRSDRFCDGALVSAFESGLILRILRSLQKS